MSWNTHIPKFRRFVLQNFPFIEQDFDALTDYELICKVIEYLNSVINSQNEVIAEVERFETDITNNFDRLEGLFNDLKSFVDNYFDNLDVQEEINNKLEDMVEDGTLQEIIADYLNSKAVFGFDTVADMKLATNLIDGSYAETLGFYSRNDGGSALYKIRTKGESETANEMNIIEISDTLVAELVVDGRINVQQLGAKTDNSADTSDMFNLAVSMELPIVIPSGEYKLDSKITISGEQDIYGEDSTIHYTGNDYAFSINSTLKKVVKFGTIDAINGGCLEFYATTTASNDFSQYVEVYFKEFKCKTNGIYAEETGEGSWVNEIRIFNGRLSSYMEGGSYLGTGVKLVHNYSGADKINGWRFYNIGFEGLTKGVHLISNAGTLFKLIFVGCRHSEAYGTLFTTEGGVNSVLFITSDSVFLNKFNLSAGTNKFRIIGPCQDPNTGQYYGFGAEYNYGVWSCDDNYPLAENDDLNNYTVEGQYFCRSNTIRQSLSNVPSEISDTADTSFVLMVKQITTSNVNNQRRVCQIIVSQKHIFHRLTYADNTWSAWRTEINDKDTAGDSVSFSDVIENKSSIDYASVERLGKIGCVRILGLHFSSTPPSTSTNAIPTEIRPLKNYIMPLWNATTNAYDAKITFKTDGHIAITNVNKSGNYGGEMMYFIA